MQLPYNRTSRKVVRVTCLQLAHLNRQAPFFHTCCCLQALRSLIKGCGEAYQPFFDTAVQQRLWSCLYHPNRFIRETAYSTAVDLCIAFAGPPLQAWAKEFAVKLQDGLSENWSQVRLGRDTVLKWQVICQLYSVMQDIISA